MNIHKIREDFSVFSKEEKVVYFDNAATTLKPKKVIDKLNEYYNEYPSNINRGLYYFAERATFEFENAREIVRAFINAKYKDEIVVTKGATESINLLAQALKRKISHNDEIIISQLEHHSNIIPWVQLCKQTGAKLRVIPVNKDGELILETYERMLNPNVKVVAVSHISNLLGIENSIELIANLAKKQGALVVVDAAQSALHSDIDVRSLDIDFMAFSAHKMFGPTGVGVLYIKKECMELLDEYQTGGNMVDFVSFEDVRFFKNSRRFEAGTPPIASFIAMGEAIKYIQNIGIQNIQAYENDLLNYLLNSLDAISSIQIVGGRNKKAPIVSFIMKGVHSHDIAAYLGSESNVAVRAGHHCCQPLIRFFGISSCVRISLACYNTFLEIDILIQGLKKIDEVFNVKN